MYKLTDRKEFRCWAFSKKKNVIVNKMYFSFQFLLTTDGSTSHIKTKGKTCVEQVILAYFSFPIVFILVLFSFCLHISTTIHIILPTKQTGAATRTINNLVEIKEKE